MKENKDINSNILMKKLLILYYSGSGSTKTIGEVLYESLKNDFQITITELSHNYNYEELSEYDFYVFGFPVFGFAPPESVIEFINKMPAFNERKKAYLYTTCAFLEENAGRIFIEKLKEKNIIINGKLGIRGPASDASLLCPESFSMVFNYEKKLIPKLKKAINEIKIIVNSDSNNYFLPKKKWYTLISQLCLPLMEKEYNKYRQSLCLLPDKCVNCNYCVNNCNYKAWLKGENHPEIDNNKCELCLKCVHNCPSSAIKLFKNMKSHRLNKAFYSKKKQEILNKLSN